MINSHSSNYRGFLGSCHYHNTQKKGKLVKPSISEIRMHSTGGTSQYHALGMFPNVTDGVKLILENYDPTGSFQDAVFRYRKYWRGENWVSFTLESQGNDKAKLLIGDGNEQIFESHSFSSDFDFDGEVKQVFWLIRGVLILPEEY